MLDYFAHFGLHMTRQLVFCLQTRSNYEVKRTIKGIVGEIMKF